MIRIANESDLNDILDITKRAVIHQQEVDQFKQWDQEYPNIDVFTQDIKKNTLYVYIDDNDNAITGFFVLNKQVYKEHYQANFTVDLSNAYTLHRVCSDPNYRGRGIGNTMLTEAIFLARKFEGESLIIDTNSKNIAMNKIVKQIGFKFVGEMQLRPGYAPWNCYEYYL